MTTSDVLQALTSHNHQVSLQVASRGRGNAVALNEPRELRRTMMSAKLRYQREVGSASRLFTNLDGQESSDLLWQDQHQRIMEAFRQYRDAVEAYLEAAGIAR